LGYGLSNALGEEDAELWFYETEAIGIARRFMHDNQYGIFGIAALSQRLLSSTTTATGQLQRRNSRPSPQHLPRPSS
jgi:hypothetical protein